MKKLWPWVLVLGLALFSLYLLDVRRQGPDPAYWVSRDAYDAKVKEHGRWLEEAAKAMEERDQEVNDLQATVDRAAVLVAELELERDKKAADGRALADENRRLKAEAAAVIATNPAIRDLINNYDLRIANYEDQVFTLTRTIGEKDKQIDALADQVVVLAYQKDLALKMFDEERSLREVSDSLRFDLERKFKRSRFWKGVAVVTNLTWAGLTIF